MDSMYFMFRPTEVARCVLKLVNVHEKNEALRIRLENKHVFNPRSGEYQKSVYYRMTPAPSGEVLKALNNAAADQLFKCEPYAPADRVGEVYVWREVPEVQLSDESMSKARELLFRPKTPEHFVFRAAASNQKPFAAIALWNFCSPGARVKVFNHRPHDDPTDVYFLNTTDSGTPDLVRALVNRATGPITGTRPTFEADSVAEVIVEPSQVEDDAWQWLHAVLACVRSDELVRATAELRFANQKWKHPKYWVPESVAIPVWVYDRADMGRSWQRESEFHVQLLRVLTGNDRLPANLTKFPPGLLAASTLSEKKQVPCIRYSVEKGPMTLKVFTFSEERALAVKDEIIHLLGQQPPVSEMEIKEASSPKQTGNRRW